MNREAHIFTNARDAIRDANAKVTETGHARVIAYARTAVGKGRGWLHYDPVTESAHAEPEFLALGKAAFRCRLVSMRWTS